MHYKWYWGRMRRLKRPRQKRRRTHLLRLYASSELDTTSIQICITYKNIIKHNPSLSFLGLSIPVLSFSFTFPLIYLLLRIHNLQHLKAWIIFAFFNCIRHEFVSYSSGESTLLVQPDTMTSLVPTIFKILPPISNSQIASFDVVLVSISSRTFH